jgi:hypothetical protein
MNEITKAPATSLGEALMRLIADPNVGPEKLEMLLKLQAQTLEARAREDFHLAFADLTRELPQVARQGLVELRTRDDRRMGSYRYARWEDMDTVIRPVLSKHGFGISFSSFIEPPPSGRTILRGKLMHVGGHYESADFPVLSDKGPGRNDLQAVGSGVSYAKRYVAELLLNVVRKDLDDDGIKAMDRKLSAEQVETLSKLIAAAKSTPERFLAIMVTDAATLADVPERDYGRLLNAANQAISRNARKERK